jgi:hypothetical protein
MRVLGRLVPSARLLATTPRSADLETMMARTMTSLRERQTIRAAMGMMATHNAAVVLLAATTAVVAVVKAAAVFNPAGARPAGAKTPAPEPPRDGRIDDDVTRFYGAVGGTLCATLWDPGSSINMITPEFAQELSRRKGIRWGFCEPVEIQHGSGDGVKSAPPAVRSLFADVVLCCKGLTFTQKNVELFVYQGCLPDVILSSKFLETIPCVEQPSVKLLDWRVSADDLRRLTSIVDSAMVQSHCTMQGKANSTGDARDKPDVQKALKELMLQRERLRERVDKAVSAEAAAAVAAVCDA